VRSLIRVVDQVNRAIEVLLGLALAGMTALIFVQVLVRFVFSKLGLQFSVPWTEELSRYLMIWSVFVGAAVVARRADALAVEALVHAVRPSVGRMIKYTAHAMALVFYVWVIYLGIEWAEFGSSETAPVLGISMVWVNASMAVGATLTLINSIVLLVETVIDKRDILDVIDFEMEEALSDVEAALAARKD